MVISYSSGGAGSWKTFFTNTPRLLLRCSGSAVISIWPQLFIATGLGILSCYWNPMDRLPERTDPWAAFSILTFLLTFLLVFKTQTAYNQHWSAITHVEDLVAAYCDIAMAACAKFDWGAHPDIKGYTRKLMRMIVLHFNILVEYFRRTGPDAVSDRESKNRLRYNIQCLTGPNEYRVLFPGEDHSVLGSDSRHNHANQLLVVFWMNVLINRCLTAGGIIGSFPSTSRIIYKCREMNQLDKTQFPLPYAQLVKAVLILWIFILPFVLQPKVQGFTPFAIFIIALSMFGLDEVAEIMEDPYGVDPNDVNLEEYRDDLVADLESMFFGREMELDTVFTDDRELCLRGITEGGLAPKSDEIFPMECGAPLPASAKIAECLVVDVENPRPEQEHPPAFGMVACGAGKGMGAARRPEAIPRSSQRGRNSHAYSVWLAKNEASIPNPRGRRTRTEGPKEAWAEQPGAVHQDVLAS